MFEEESKRGVIVERRRTWIRVQSCLLCSLAWGNAGRLGDLSRKNFLKLLKLRSTLLQQVSPVPRVGSGSGDGTDEARCKARNHVQMDGRVR